MPPTKGTFRLDQAKLNRLLRDRNGPVGKVMAGFAGLSTTAVRDLARERITSRTGAYIDGIRSTTEQSVLGTKMITTASAPQSAILEKGSKPHVIVPKRAKVLRFEVGGQTVWTRRVSHPGTKPYNIVRDGVRRAGGRLKSKAG